MGMRKIMRLHTCLIPVIIKLTLLMLFSQNGDCECIYNFDGIENGITFGLNIANSDTVFKFTIVNQTGHIMSDKHAIMLTDYSKYYHVSDDYLKTRRCPYPGLIEHLRFGIQDEISCEVTVTVTADKAISELRIPEDLFVWIDGRTPEPEISIYLLQLNVNKECTTYICYIECENDNNQHFIAATAGRQEEYKSLFYVYTASYSIKYSPFRYELLFACYDMIFHDSTLVTAKTKLTFTDTSARSSEATPPVSTARTPRTTMPPSLTFKALPNTTTKILSSSEHMLPSLPTFVTETTVPSTLTTFNTTRNVSSLVSKHQQIDISTSPGISKPRKASTMYLTSTSTADDESISDISLGYPKRKRTTTNSFESGNTQTSTQFVKLRAFAFASSIFFTTPLTSSVGRTKPWTLIDKYFLTLNYTRYISTQTPEGYSMNTVLKESRTESLTNTSVSLVATSRYLKGADLSTFMITNKTYSTEASLTEQSAVIHESFLDDPVHVIVISTVAGVIAAGAVRAGAYVLVSKRTKIRRNKTESSDETENAASSPGEGKTTQQRPIP